MNSTVKKSIKASLIILLAIISMFLIYKLSFYIAPFIVAFAISSSIEPLIRFLTNKAKISRRLASLISVLFVVSTFGTVITIIIVRLISEISSLKGQINNIVPEYYEKIEITVATFINKANDLYLWLPTEVTDYIDNFLKTSDIPGYITQFLNIIFDGILAFAKSIPQIFLFTLVTILATYFLASDRKRIHNFMLDQLPNSWVNKMQSIRDDLFSALFGYIRAQLILMTITFTELNIGFAIMKVKHSLLISFFISIIDAFPILGTGGIVIPWAIYEFITKNYRMGVSLLIIYVIVLIVRQLTEPKILGQQIGVHPLLTLFAMYTGLQFLGVKGLILGPIIVLIV